MAEWLENLILIGAIAPGVVDRRSIEDVAPSDLKDFTQCHFFAGAGVWSHALRNAGWPDDRPVWTGSCPCQPFSQAGQGGGLDDERHLWPALHHLAVLCQPSVIFGEQVSSKDGLAWLDLVHTDMEATEYAFGALDLCAAGVGAPHIRQRSYWLAHAPSSRLTEFSGRRVEPSASPEGRALGVVANLRDPRFQIGSIANDRRTALREQRPSGATDGLPSGLADAHGRDAGPERQQRGGEQRFVTSAVVARDESRGPGPTNGFWGNADWLACRDGRWRPVEPGTFPRVNGASNRVGSLRGYGNAIAGPLATEFVRVAKEYLDGA